jgi:hypothetical protein
VITNSGCAGAATFALKNCLSVACAGGSTYSYGVTYTNSSGVPVIEFVGITATGSCTGADTTINAIVNGVTGSGNGVYNNCAGVASITFVVPAGATFSANITFHNAGASITSWSELSL